MEIQLKDSTQAILRQLNLDNPYSDFNHQDYPSDLQGWGSTDPLFAQLIDQIRPKIIIEVGTWKGCSAIHIAKLLQEKQIDGTIICVDTWLGGIEHLSGEYAKSLAKKHGWPTLYYQFLANVMSSEVHPYITPLPLPSNIAARWLKKNDLKADLIYIDASHEEEDVYADLNNYWNLVAPQGILLGDDYADLNHIGVATAVHRFANERQLSFKTARNKWWIQKPSDPQDVINALNRRIAQLELMSLANGVEMVDRTPLKDTV